jgi:hypothetical protein
VAVAEECLSGRVLGCRSSDLSNLVGGFNPSEKYEFVSWDDEIPNICKNKKCSKPPTLD